jgi:RimJ/RimL family protein N-acetyltransferase
VYSVCEFALRKPEMKDIDALYVQKNDPEIDALLGGFNAGYTRQDLATWIEFHRTARDEAFFVIVADDDTVVGHVALYKIDRRIGHAEFAIMLGKKSTWGKGLGKACTSWMIEYGFGKLDLQRIYLEVLANNERAVGLYRQLGFVEEGRLRDHQLKNGQYHDVIVMGLLRSEYRKCLAKPDRWEQGSDFHLVFEPGVLDAPWIGQAHTLWGSGRDAIRALLAWGRVEEGWARLFVPSLFCQDVVAALARELPVSVYGDPLQGAEHAQAQSIAAGPKDVVLVVNTYGARSRPNIDNGAVIVEDHTHDPLSPWAFASDADWAVASLRKTLPVPDGGVLWSPKGRPLPPEREITPVRAVAAFDRLAAMVLKSHYLQGLDVNKEAFRARAMIGERSMGLGDISGISDFSRARLPTLPARAWREVRERNLTAFREALGDISGALLLDVPFAATLLFDSPEQRDRVRIKLIEGRIYPAVLWSLESPMVDGILERDIELSRRLLSLHCDFRYGVADMRRVARAVRAALANGPAECQ